MMRLKVVVIGHSFTSRLGIIRSVAQIGCSITVIVLTGYKRFSKTLKDAKQIDCYSKYVDETYYCYGSDEKGLIQLLLNKCADAHQKVIIIPDSDFSAAVIDRNQDKLKNSFLFPHINHHAGAVAVWMNKEKQKSLAKVIGLHVADGTVVEITQGRYELPQTIKYPCFTKPLLTIAGGKKLLHRCDQKSTLRKILDKAARLSPSIGVLIEDYKAIEEEYAVLGFSDGKKTIIPAVIKFLQSSQSHPGIALRGEIMPTKGFEDIINQFKIYVQQIGFCGLFDIDFYLSEGKLYFGELNLRFGGSGYAVTKMGVNLPGMMVKTLCGERIDEMKREVKTSATFVNERMCLDDWYHGYLSVNELHQLIETADIRFIDDGDDRTPQYAFEQTLRKKSIRKPLVKYYIRMKNIISNIR